MIFSAKLAILLNVNTDSARTWTLERRVVLV